MLGRGMVDHCIQNDLHAALVQVAGQLGELCIAAEVGIDLEVVLGIVLVVARRIEDGVEVECRDPEGLQIVQLGIYPRQVPAVKLTGAESLFVTADRLPPPLADHRLASVLVFMMLHAQGRIAVAKAVGKDLVEHLILHPGWRLVQAVETKVLLPRRHGRADASAVQPPLLLIGQAFEAVEVDILPFDQWQCGLPHLQSVPGRDWRHRQQVLFVVRFVAQPHLPDRGIQLAEQGELQAVGALFEPGRHLGMKQKWMGHECLLSQKVGEGITLFVKRFELACQRFGIQSQLVGKRLGETGNDGLGGHARIPGEGDEDGEPDQHRLLADRIVGEGIQLLGDGIDEGFRQVPAPCQFGTELGIVVSQHLPLGLYPAAPLLDRHIDELGLFRQCALDKQLTYVVDQGTGKGGLGIQHLGLLGQGLGDSGNLEGLGPELVLVEAGGGLEGAYDAGGDHHGAQPVETEADHRLLDGGDIIATAQGGRVGHPQHLDADHLVHGDLARYLVDACIFIAETLHQLMQQLRNSGELFDLVKQTIHRHG